MNLMIRCPLVLIVVLFLSQATCSFYDDPAKRIDRLLAQHRIYEAQKLLDSSFAMPQMVCTTQVISRCIDLRNFKPLQPWQLSNENQPQVSRSFSRALVDGLVSVDPDEIKREANKILDSLIPHALQNKEVITAALNTAAFHSDYDLMTRLISFGWDKFGADSEGFSPLMKAFKHHRRPVFNWLLDQGADIHFVNDAGDNLVHIWARTIHCDFVISQIIHDLIMYHGLDWTRENLAGFTPLAIAKARKNQFFLELLSNDHLNESN